MYFGEAAATISKLLLVLVLVRAQAGSGSGIGFTLNGFRSVNMDLNGIAAFTSSGLLRLTNESKQQVSHAFYPDHFTFKNSSAGSALSFSTTFVFAMVSTDGVGGGHGIAFVVAPQRHLPGGLPSTYFGLFNRTNIGKATNHIFAVELDTVQNTEFQDPNDNHVGIDINGLISAKYASAGFYPDGEPEKLKNLTLLSGLPMQVWVEYDGVEKRIDVTMAPIRTRKPRIPLLSLSYDLSTIVKETMFVGFSSSTGSFLFSRNYILGWSFQMNGQVQDLDISKLPKLPRIGKKPTSKLLTIGVPAILLLFLSVLISGLTYYVRRRWKFAEVLEDWELDYGPQRFKYKDLYIACRGFRDQELLGTGGFGSVYRGTLATSKIDIAVKKISHNSRQGIREFVAEIVSIGQLRHRNLVTLLGYCRRQGELLLVYDYMSNGSLDKYLWNQPKAILKWTQRLRIIKGVASGLLYLHEGWEQVVIHRDIKASNVLLDADLNGKLGDFGLARLYDHGSDPQTTHVVGTLGYLAPEQTKTGRATKAMDVFSFGTFLLEVVTGRRPIESRGTEEVILIDWVLSLWSSGRDILEARDPNMGDEFVAEEVELLLKLGLVCSHLRPAARPSMRQVVQYLEGDDPTWNASSLDIPLNELIRIKHREGIDDYFMSYSSSMDNTFSLSCSVSNSLLSGGR